MSDTSRRNFMAAAGVGAATAATVGTIAIGSGAAEASPSAKRAKEGVVALVDDHRGDAVRLLIGEREIVVHDRDLVIRILNAAGGK